MSSTLLRCYVNIAYLEMIIFNVHKSIWFQDQEATATEVVTRKVREKDATISDEKARSALGALGLIGEKAIRKVGHLSGTVQTERLTD